MWWFSKKNKVLDLSWLVADMHSHLIPGIDDGSPDMATSLQLVKALREFGFQKLITTPHVFQDFYPNTSEVILQGLAALRSAAETEKIHIELQAAAEYFLDEHFEEELKSKMPLLSFGGNLLLVEFSMVTAKIDLQEVLFEIQIRQYQPVIAHPERYVYLSGKKSVFDDLKANGCLFQLNLLSLTGYYGRSVQILAEYLIDKNYYDFAGTDLHHHRHITALQKLSGNKWLQQLKDSGRLRNDRL